MRKSRWLWLPARAVQNVLLAAAIATLSILCTSSDTRYIPELSPFYTLERTGYDFLFTLRGPKLDRIDNRIMVVGFDRESEKDLHTRWPAPRRFHADVIRNLKNDGAALIVYDVLFSDGTTPEDDKKLDQALKDAGNVVLPIRIDRDPTLKRESLEEPYYNDDLNIDFLSNAVDGFAEVPQDDTDDVVRRITPIMYFQDKPVPSMAAAAYLKLKGLSLTNLAIKKDSIQVGDVLIPKSGPTIQDPFNKKYLISSAYMDFPAGNLSFPLDITFADVARKNFPKGTFRGKIVFVGLAGQEQLRENYDAFVTAYTNHSPESFGSIGYVKTMPGVFLQALNFNALMHDGFVKKFPGFGVWILVFGLSIAGAVSVRSSFNWRGPAVLMLCTILYITYCIEVFANFQIYLPWVVPSVLMLSSIMLITYLERGSLRRKWSGYVSPQVLETILKGESSDVAAQRYRASVVFGDIRGFTAFTTMHSPETVVKLLNMHFERMTKIIYEEQGTIDKFFGDGVMVLFGAPVALEKAAVYAVRAAWRMCEASQEPLMLDGEAFVLSSGFGVTTGWLVAGHVGSKMRHDYTVIGEIVNLSSRLQGVTGAADVVIDATTMHLVKEYVDVMPLGQVFIKGMPDQECFRVIAWHDKATTGRGKAKMVKNQKAGISS